MADNVIAFRRSSVISASTFTFPKLFVRVFNRESKWDASLGFLRNDFRRALKINNHSRIIHRNDDIARLVRT